MRRPNQLADRVNQLAERLDLPLLFVRGNHYNWQALSKLQPLPGEVFCRLREHVWYLPDGQIMSYENGGESISIASLGGATSIDRDWRLEEEARTRKPRSIYWPEEGVSVEAARRLINSGRTVDLLLTHEAPLSLHRSGLLNLLPPDQLPPEFEEDSALDIAMVSAAWAALKPRLHAHGHHHKRLTVETEFGPIVGLGMEGDRFGSMILWDSKTGEVTDVEVVRGRF